MKTAIIIAVIFITWIKKINFMSRMLVRLTVDAVLVSTVLAGIRRSGNLEFKTKTIENETLRLCVEKFLSVGDYVLDTSISQLQTYKTYVEKKK
jgi:hypothetical protein